MKSLLLFSLALAPLFAQIEPGVIQYLNIGTTEYEEGTVTKELLYDVVVINGTKVILFDVLECYYPPIPARLIKLYLLSGGQEPYCQMETESQALAYSAVGAVLNNFDSQYPDGEQWYIPLALPSTLPSSGPAVHPALTTLQPVPSPDPQAIFLDGLGNSLIAVDMTTFAVVGQVVVPSTSGPFGIRPNTTGPSNEVWVANAGFEVAAGAEVSVVNLGTQTLVTNIPTPSIPASASPAGIVFTNDGATGFEAFRYSSPDSSGNNGALVVFDAVGRTVFSTFPLKNAPAALVMAPDGLTIYLLSSNGNLTYYDVFSGTADLTVSTVQPGSNLVTPGARCTSIRTGRACFGTWGCTW